ncbi:MAG: hypothetical protein M5U28_52520 [Sandaracinaceae bacterium]|nr:hypothetical protein [Sandaracinaceae bacterium]
MTRWTWLIAGGLAAALVAIVVAYDALVVSDEERLEALIEDSTGSITAARIERGRARWLDLARQPFEISGFGEARSYGAGDEAALDDRAADAARTLAGDSLRAISSGVRVEGDRGTVTMRVLGQRLGMAQIEWSLRKHGDDWLVSRLSIRR